jgi:putative membrane protein
MGVDRFFSVADHEAVEAAVREAEATTSGEIVPYAVGRSDDYREAPWTAALLGALLAAAAAAALVELGDLWLAAPALWTAAAAAVGGAAGYGAAALLDPLARLLVTRSAMEAAVERRARAAFVDRQVFATRERTGILLFLSLFERRVVVLADAGIDARVAQGEWDEIASGIAAGIRAGRPGEAVAQGIRACGVLLANAGVTRRADDRDELGDELRAEEK